MRPLLFLTGLLAAALAATVVSTSALPPALKEVLTTREYERPLRTVRAHVGPEAPVSPNDNSEEGAGHDDTVRQGDNGAKFVANCKADSDFLYDGAVLELTGTLKASLRFEIFSTSALECATYTFFPDFIGEEFNRLFKEGKQNTLDHGLHKDLIKYRKFICQYDGLSSNMTRDALRVIINRLNNALFQLATVHERKGYICDQISLYLQRHQEYMASSIVAEQMFRLLFHKCNLNNCELPFENKVQYLSALLLLMRRQFAKFKYGQLLTSITAQYYNELAKYLAALFKTESTATSTNNTQLPMADSPQSNSISNALTKRELTTDALLKRAAAPLFAWLVSSSATVLRAIALLLRDQAGISADRDTLINHLQTFFDNDDTKFDVSASITGNNILTIKGTASLASIFTRPAQQTFSLQPGTSIADLPHDVWQKRYLALYSFTFALESVCRIIHMATPKDIQQPFTDNIVQNNKFWKVFTTSPFVAYAIPLVAEYNKSRIRHLKAKCDAACRALNKHLPQFDTAHMESLVWQSVLDEAQRCLGVTPENDDELSHRIFEFLSAKINAFLATEVFLREQEIVHYYTTRIEKCKVKMQALSQFTSNESLQALLCGKLDLSALFKL